MLSLENIHRLETQPNIWIASVRRDGRPHLAPVWFVWFQGKIYIATDPKSVKAGNLRKRPRVTMALEDGSHPVICEGTAHSIDRPWPANLLAAFWTKYEWDLNKETQYHDVWGITPEKWLTW